MYRFFIEEGIQSGQDIHISGADYNHIRHVLRMKAGEQVLLSDGQDREYLCEIIGFEEKEVLLRILDIMGTSRELPTEITLFQGLPKGDKMEQIIQKTVELGVYRIVPVAMKRCIVRLDDKKAAKKVERWHGIALSAAKQSKRGIVPEVSPVLSWEEAWKLAASMDACLIPYENAEGIEGARSMVKAMRGKRSIGIFIGPEGGFDDAEIAQALQQGGQTMTLGRRILRTETAGMAMLSILMFALEE